MQNYIPKKDKYDDMMVEIGTNIFNLQMILAKFVSDILCNFNNYRTEINIKIPFIDEDKIKILSTKEIIFDIEEEIIKLSVDEGADNFEWNQFDINTQNEIANELHIIYTTENIYNNLSADNDIH